MSSRIDYSKMINLNPFDYFDNIDDYIEAIRIFNDLDLNNTKRRKMMGFSLTIFNQVKHAHWRLWNNRKRLEKDGDIY